MGESEASPAVRGGGHYRLSGLLDYSLVGAVLLRFHVDGIKAAQDLQHSGRLSDCPGSARYAGLVGMDMDILCGHLFDVPVIVLWCGNPFFLFTR